MPECKGAALINVEGYIIGSRWLAIESGEAENPAAPVFSIRQAVTFSRNFKDTCFTDVLLSNELAGGNVEYDQSRLICSRFVG